MSEHIDIPTFLSMLVGAFVVIGFAYSAYYNKKQKDSNDAELMLKISTEISNRESNAVNSTDITQVEMNIQDLVNYCDLISYMLISKKLDENQGEFFKRHIIDAYISAKYVDTQTPSKKMMATSADLVTWVEENYSNDDKMKDKSTAQIMYEHIRRNSV